MIKKKSIPKLPETLDEVEANLAQLVSTIESSEIRERYALYKKVLFLIAHAMRKGLFSVENLPVWEKLYMKALKYHAFAGEYRNVIALFQKERLKALGITSVAIIQKNEEKSW